MVKWNRVIAFDVVMAILVILLYSPFNLGLSPLDPNFIKAALSVICAALIGYETVKVNGKAIKSARAAKRLTAGSSEVSVEDIKLALHEYEKVSVVGQLAQSGIAELESAERKRNNLYAIIGGKFQEGSLSWQKFTEVVESVSQAVAHNSALLAKRIQTFDVEDYNRMKRGNMGSLFKRSTIPEDVRQEKIYVMEASLNDMRSIVSTNEQLLLELDKFGVEMGQLEASAHETKNTRMLEEINELINETKYYR